MQVNQLLKNPNTVAVKVALKNIKTQYIFSNTSFPYANTDYPPVLIVYLSQYFFSFLRSNICHLSIYYI